MTATTSEIPPAEWAAICQQHQQLRGHAATEESVPPVPLPAEVQHLTEKKK